MINYSVIIPHKNIPNLLQRCLDSIPRRDDVQIIVVDDNSDADKVDFENFPGLNDPFVEVIFGKNENGRKGAGYARNLGLERAVGKWLVFADADDFFMPCFNEVLDKYKDDDENDIVYFKVTSSDLNNGRHHSINVILCEVKKHNDWDKLSTIHIVPYGKFIKNHIVKSNKIYFQEVQHSNDIMFGIKVNYSSNRKQIDDNIIYLVTERNGSLSTIKTIKATLIRFEGSYDINKYLQQIKKPMIGNTLDSWLQILRMNKKVAIKLMPKVIQVCNLYIFVTILTKDYPKLKHFFFWKILMKFSKADDQRKI